MDLTKTIKPLSAIAAGLFTTVTVALGAGGAWALTAEKVNSHESRIQDLERQSQDGRERLARLEEMLRSTKELLERIDRKLDR